MARGLGPRWCLLRALAPSCNSAAFPECGVAVVWPWCLLCGSKSWPLASNSKLCGLACDVISLSFCFLPLWDQLLAS